MQVDVVAFTFGDGKTSEFTFDHVFGDNAFAIVFRKYPSGKSEYIEPGIDVHKECVHVSYAPQHAPAQDQDRICIFDVEKVITTLP